MSKKTIIKSGNFRRVNQNGKILQGELDLDVWFSKELAENNVPGITPCCPCPENVPVRVNVDPDTDAITMQYYDCITEDWIDLVLTEQELETLIFTNGEGGTLSITDILSTSHLAVITGEDNIKVDDPMFLNHGLGHGIAKAVNVTGAVTAAELANGFITSTSAAAVAITLPTATLLAAEIDAVRGNRFQFLVDNSAGANTITLDLTGTGITTGTSPITGGSTLTVSTANVIGLFELFFTSTTAAIIRRIA